MISASAQLPKRKNLRTPLALKINICGHQLLQHGAPSCRLAVLVEVLTSSIVQQILLRVSFSCKRKTGASCTTLESWSAPRRRVCRSANFHCVRLSAANTSIERRQGQLHQVWWRRPSEGHQSTNPIPLILNTPSETMV